MSTGSILPGSWLQAKPLLEQYLQQISAAIPIGPVKAPNPPRNLLAQSGSMQVVLSWDPPQLVSGISGYRIYKGDESHLFQTIHDPNTTQCTIPVPANTFVGLYVSCFNSVGVESAKIFILGQSNTDQHVVSGTAGGTGGTVPIAPARACFSGDVELIALRGVIRFDELRLNDLVLTAKGNWREIEAIHEHYNWSGLVYEWPGGGYVTEDETLLLDDEWRSAALCGLGCAKPWQGTVYHGTVKTDEAEELRFSPKTERSITLANGWKAHNVKIYTL